MYSTAVSVESNVSSLPSSLNHKKPGWGQRTISIARGIIALIYGVAAQSAADGQAILPLTAEQVADLAIRLAGAPA